jgi:hypothetical protein
MVVRVVCMCMLLLFLSKAGREGGREGGNGESTDDRWRGRLTTRNLVVVYRKRNVCVCLR